MKRSNEPLKKRSGLFLLLFFLFLFFFLLLFFLWLLLLLFLRFFLLVFFFLFFFFLDFENVAAGFQEPDFVAPEEWLEWWVVAGGDEAVGVDGQVARSVVDQVEQGLLFVVPVGLLCVASKRP